MEGLGTGRRSLVGGAVWLAILFGARIMSDARKLRIEPGKVFTAACACCASETRTLSGFVYSGDAAFGAYFVTGAVGRPEHDASFDLILGSFGDAACGDRRGVSVVFRSGPQGGFMVVDATPRLRGAELVDVAMTRQDVVSGPWAATVFEVLDAIWLQDHRISDLVAPSSLPDGQGESP